MAEIDRQKEKVSNYRLVWGISLTALFGMIAFIFNSFDKLIFMKKILIAISFFVLIIFVLYLTWKLKVETDKLKDL